MPTFVIVSRITRNYSEMKNTMLPPVFAYDAVIAFVFK